MELKRTPTSAAQVYAGLLGAVLVSMAVIIVRILSSPSNEVDILGLFETHCIQPIETGEFAEVSDYVVKERAWRAITFGITESINLGYLSETQPICSISYKITNVAEYETYLEPQLEHIASRLSNDLAATYETPFTFHWLTQSSDGAIWGLTYDHDAHDDVSQLAILYPKGIDIPRRLLAP